MYISQVNTHLGAPPTSSHAASTQPRTRAHRHCSEALTEGGDKEKQRPWRCSWRPWLVGPHWPAQVPQTAAWSGAPSPAGLHLSSAERCVRKDRKQGVKDWCATTRVTGIFYTSMTGDQTPTSWLIHSSYRYIVYSIPPWQGIKHQCATFMTNSLKLQVYCIIYTSMTGDETPMCHLHD